LWRLKPGGRKLVVFELFMEAFHKYKAIAIVKKLGSGKPPPSQQSPHGDKAPKIARLFLSLSHGKESFLKRLNYRIVRFVILIPGHQHISG
jgi:hypothetical protein